MYKKRSKLTPAGNAKEVIYDGIKFKSGLECFCYKELKKNGIKFEYESETIPLVQSRKSSFPIMHSPKTVKSGTKRVIKDNINIPKITYTPDFVGENFKMETKGNQLDSFSIKWKLFLNKLNDENYKGIVLMARNQTEVLECIKIIKEN